MKKYFKFIIYYILLILGLCLISWLIWSRFIRDIPDASFTELRFWILLYLCFIYAYSIKHLLKNHYPNEILSQITTLCYTPLTTLDHSLKYNGYLIQYYYNFIKTIIKLINTTSEKHILGVIFSLQILPRILLVTLLLVDTFWFHRLEIMYKAILIGLLPFIFRYLNYCLKDVYDYWVEELDLYYNFIIVFQEYFGYDYKVNAEFIPIHHFKKKFVKEYIEIKYENWQNYHDNIINYEYVGSLYPRDNIFEEYRLQKYKDNPKKFMSQDFEHLRMLFKELMPQVLDLKFLL